MKFILGSSNSKKVKELNGLISGVEVVPPIQKLDIEETGPTFSENSYLKAKGYADYFNAPACADDSGLVIEKCPEILGVKSARFAPEHDDNGKCVEVLKYLADKGIEKAEAYFICVLCFYISEEEIYFFEGRCDGYIHTELLAKDQGFGYDPIFIPKHLGEVKSFSQVPEWKMSNSHRAKACFQAKRFFDQYCQNI